LMGFKALLSYVRAGHAGAPSNQLAWLGVAGADAAGVAEAP
jgi:hypothetical protein